MIIKKLVVPRVRPTMGHFELLQAIVHIGIVRIASSDFHVTRTAARVLPVVWNFPGVQYFLVRPTIY